MYSKAKIFNLALNALLLQRQIIDPDTDKSNEAKVLLTHYDEAFRATLADLDLDSTATQADLELIETDPNQFWLFAYKYPSDCVFFRRIQSTAVMDNRTTHISKRIAIHKGKKVIFCNEDQAVGEYIPADIPLSSLSANVGLAIAYRLAILSSALIVGKGAERLRKEIEAKYVLTKVEAQEQDRSENFNFIDENIESEFVEIRTS